MATVTVDIKGIEFEVEYSYDQGQEEIRYDSNMSGQDYIPESFEIHSIYHGKTDFAEFFDGDEDLIIDAINDSFGI